MHHRSSATGDVHSGCIVCGYDNDQGLHLSFHHHDDGSVSTDWSCDGNYQGYPNILHGGIVAMLLDGAMTHCLFAHRITAVTAEMTIRYLHPVRTGRMIEVRAWLQKANPKLYALGAELTQDDRIACRATAKFIPTHFDNKELTEHENCHPQR